MQITKLFTLVLVSFTLFMSCSNDELAEDDFKLLNRKNLGASAQDLLNGANYTSLAIEIVAVNGYQPDANAVKGFKSFLERHLHKPDGIKINQRKVSSSGFAPFAVDQIIELENKHRSQYTTGDELTVYIYFADGSAKDDTETNITLGSAYFNSSIVIYGKTIRKLADHPTAPALSTIENAVLNHEFGHLLGLLNMGTLKTAAHEDHKSKGHCNVAGCLMQADMEFPSQMMEVLGKGVPELDAKCIAYLQAHGGR